MKTTTKILLGMGAYILTFLYGIAIASTNDHIANQLTNPVVSMSNLRPPQPILITSRDEQGEESEDREDDDDHKDREDGNDHEDHTENS